MNIFGILGYAGCFGLYFAVECLLESRKEKRNTRHYQA